MILDEILANKRLEVAQRRILRPLSMASATGSTAQAAAWSAHALAGSNSPAIAGSAGAATGAGHAGPGGDEPGSANAPVQASGGARFTAALRQSGVSFIAEIKRKSPSGGELRPDLSAADLAQLYASAGAAALSVLTDQRYFGGSDADLLAAQQASGLPALRKDFVIDPYQILEARELGADAVLLIVRALSDALLHELLDLTHQCGMEALVETHSAPEVERALAAGARIVGVNNRDLDTLITDVSLAPSLRALVPGECVFVAESGIARPDDVAVLVDAGVDAVLIGESLLRAADPGAKLRSLVAAGTPRAVLGGGQ